MRSLAAPTSHASRGEALGDVGPELVGAGHHPQHVRRPAAGPDRAAIQPTPGPRRGADAEHVPGAQRTGAETA